jgi:hypothetical protein
MSSHLYICRSRPIVKNSSTKSINSSFIFLRVRVNVTLLLPQIPELATVLAFPRPDVASVEVGHISIADAHR